MFTAILTLMGVLVGIMLGLLLSVPIFNAAYEAGQNEREEGARP